MIAGVLPVGIIYVWLRDEKNKHGVRWFLLGTGMGGLWSLTVSLMILTSGIPHYVVSNIFVVVPPLASLFWFYFSYEFTFKEPIPRESHLLLIPIVLLFVLVWFNPANLFFAPDYPFSGRVMVFESDMRIGVIAVTSVYGYLIVALAGGLLFGAFVRETGLRRIQAGLVLVPTALIAIVSMIRIAGPVPSYYDPTPTSWAVSGLLFAYSIRTQQLWSVSPAGRERAVEEVNDATIILNPDDLISDMNPAARELFDISTDPTGKPVTGVFDGYTDVLREFEDEYETEVNISLTVEGAERYFSLSISPVEYGRDLRGRVVVLREITELKERERQLKTSEKRYRALAENFPRGAVALFDESLEYTLVRGLDDTAMSADDFEGSSIEEVHSTGYVERFVGKFEAVFEAERSEFEFSHGSNYFKTRLVPVTDDHGDVLLGMSVTVDITELREREEDLALLKQILSRVFRHNVRNDLVPIQGYAEVIEARGDDEMAREYAADIVDTAEQLHEQVEKARQLEEVVDTDQTTTKSLAAVVEHVIAERESEHPGAAIGQSVADVSVECHEKLGTAISELVANAIQHNDGSEPPEVEVYTEETNDSIVLFVEDDGPGIPQNEVDVLGVEEETDLQHGSGVGLWLVRWIVERSNGELLPEATGTGTRIGIRLRMVDRE